MNESENYLIDTDSKAAAQFLQSLFELQRKTESIKSEVEFELMFQLTESAQADRDEYERLVRITGGCSCHLHPPCSCCTHPGNPLGQAEDETCWEPRIE